MYNLHAPTLFETRYGTLVRCECCTRIQITFRDHVLLVDEAEFELLVQTVQRALTQLRQADGQSEWTLQAQVDNGSGLRVRGPVCGRGRDRSGASLGGVAAIVPPGRKVGRGGTSRLHEDGAGTLVRFGEDPGRSSRRGRICSAHAVLSVLSVGRLENAPGRRDGRARGVRGTGRPFDSVSNCDLERRPPWPAFASRTGRATAPSRPGAPAP